MRDLQLAGAFASVEESRLLLDAMVKEGRLVVNSTSPEKGGHTVVIYQVAR